MDQRIGLCLSGCLSREQVVSDQPLSDAGQNVGLKVA